MRILIYTLKAPPPPIHKYPSWEDRIYQIASGGIKASSSDIVIGAQIDSRNNNLHQATSGYGPDIKVPVYATVKGVSCSQCYENYFRNYV